MNASMLNAAENQSRLKVSILTRLLAALLFSIPAIGGALSSFLLINVFRALRDNESAGVAAIMGGLNEASLPAIISLYLAAVCGIGVIAVLVTRMFMATKTASPSSWFFVIGGILCLLPTGPFWYAKWLTLEVLSPGSPIGAGGIASVGAEISQWLLLSVVAMPIVIIILIVLSVLPFSSRSRAKWIPLVVATAIEILLIAVAVAVPFLINEPSRKNDLVSLPVNVKYADSDYELSKNTSVILTLTADNKLYQRQIRDLPDKVEIAETIIAKEDLLEKLKSSMADKTPDKRIVYFKCDVNASFENVLQVFDIIRKADLEKVGLVVIGEKNADDPYQISPLSFEVRLPAPTVKTDVPVKPNPLTLIAMLEADGRLSLNREDQGMISKPKTLEDMLVRVFKERENSGVFREGTNEIEKTVFLKVSKSNKYGDFIKLVEAVKLAGAEPIGIQFEDIRPIEIIDRIEYLKKR